MDELQLQSIAQQLRKPEGEQGIMVGSMMNEGNRIINEYVLETLNAQPGEKILEIGMGNGYFVKDIVSTASNIEYAGCDYSETMIAEANEMNKDLVEACKARFHLVKADKLPFEDASFDKAFCVNVIYFWQQPENELAEIRRVLRPGGKFIIGIRPKNAMQKMPFTKYGFTMYSKDELTALLEANSFSLINVFEKQEPPQEVNGIMIYPESLVVEATQS
jgi:ubiquinone/menaquinone biosynthesis C-methylase UbiE